MKVNYSEIRTILEENECEVESIIDVNVIGSNEYRVQYLDYGMVIEGTIKDRKYIAD